MSDTRRVNPLPMGTAVAAGQTTDAMRLQMAQAFGRRGGMRSAATRRKKRAGKRKVAAKRKRTNGRKLKFGSPAWRKKYMGKRKRARK